MEGSSWCSSAKWAEAEIGKVAFELLDRYPWGSWQSKLSAASSGKTESLGWGSWNPLCTSSICMILHVHLYVLISFGSWSAKMVRWRLPWVLAARSYSLTTFQLHVVRIHFPSNPNNCMWPDDGTLMVLLVQYSFQHHCDSSPGFERWLLLICSCSASVRAGFETSSQRGSSQSKILQTCFAESILVGLWIYLSINNIYIKLIYIYIYIKLYIMLLLYKLLVLI